mmetsp:Transcript_11745/g.28945  ORF Transcript_11745/g.28945 Transcript_11745/m.28945 type:complete len:514 (+) Transcript_11745:228-1769(+)|eukprot:CAMPEP_0114494620 /NCGR_PEP_ID=MMETSP0109-20121206/4752_1 /TAXON_ID=29199 /ORGANISM="Chlorarachnion reptans, Strain CCCM449" /LENGTH=513 /DNA_ID=CAMNT_0001671675 /DNA_START=125 /DNA_END=1666 /DNA_ORIENTATION=+
MASNTHGGSQMKLGQKKLSERLRESYRKKTTGNSAVSSVVGGRDMPIVIKDDKSEDNADHNNRDSEDQTNNRNGRTNSRGTDKPPPMESKEETSTSTSSVKFRSSIHVDGPSMKNRSPSLARRDLTGRTVQSSATVGPSNMDGNSKPPVMTDAHKIALDSLKDATKSSSSYATNPSEVSRPFALYKPDDIKSALDFFSKNVDVYVEIDLKSSLGLLTRCNSDIHNVFTSETPKVPGSLTWKEILSKLGRFDETAGDALRGSSPPLIGRLNLCGDPRGDYRGHKMGLSRLRLKRSPYLRKRIVFVVPTVPEVQKTISTSINRRQPRRGIPNTKAMQQQRISNFYKPTQDRESVKTRNSSRELRRQKRKLEASDDDESETVRESLAKAARMDSHSSPTLNVLSSDDEDQQTDIKSATCTVGCFSHFRHVILECFDVDMVRDLCKRANGDVAGKSWVTSELYCPFPMAVIFGPVKLEDVSIVIHRHHKKQRYQDTEFAAQLQTLTKRGINIEWEED